MKAVYNIKTMRRKPHPLHEKIERCELRLVDHLAVPDAEFQSLISALEPQEREIAMRVRAKALVSA